MKKLICSMAAVLFLTAFSAPVFADQAKMESTPTAKTMKHKKTHHKRKVRKGKTAMKAETTPTAKK